jgi:hypothetical protein
MKRFISDFLNRGLKAAFIGPIVLAVIYLIIQNGEVTMGEVSVGIFSLTALSFIAGGLNAIYQIERLPLLSGVLIHGAVLYLSYLGVYLINGWLDFGATPLLVFSAIFVVGYIVIWAVIYSVIKKKTENINKLLKEKQSSNN